MRHRVGLPIVTFLSAAVLTAAGCAGRARPSVPATPAPQRAQAPVPVPASPPATPAPADPVAALIAASERHFQNGQRELELGHLTQARAEFDRAVEVLIGSPSGARTEPRLRDQFDRLVDRISALEVAALAAGDGFTEKPSEPASIDELLATSVFDKSGAPAPETARVVEADLAHTSHDIPIPFNERVLRYVELFQGKLREWVQSGLQRGAKYLPMIQNVFRAEGLPLDLAYVPLIESAFKPTALSRAKARGVWQFMKDTALENGLRHDWYIDERADPEKATQAAAKYLRTLNRMFDGDWHLALASYNGGPGRVQRALKQARMSDFWDLSSSTRFLPRETREYVPMILAAIIIARNPSQYGFLIEPESPLAFEKVRLDKPVDLRLVAEWTGTSIDEVQSLNPELRRWTTPVRDTEYEVKVPAGTALQLQQRLASASPADLSNLKWHTVKRGETLASIARRFRVSRTDLAEANEIRTTSRLRPGQELLIPRAPAQLLVRHVDRPAPEPVALASTTAITSSRAPAEVVPAETTKLVHRVRRGDTLSSIARLYETSIEAIRAWNRLRTSRISVGDRLTIYPNHLQANLRD